MLNVAIFGSGGLGRSMSRLISVKKDIRVVCILDSNGYAFDSNGINHDLVENFNETVANIPGIGCASDNSIDDVLNKYAEHINAIFIALPNLPNYFVPDVAKKIAESSFSGVIVDALKRTSAAEILLDLNDVFLKNKVLYLCGAGATPGMLSAVASIAAQSFVEIKEVSITFGVGISNWNAYRATIREDIAHLAGFNPEIVSNMTEKEIEVELEKRHGVLDLVNMEHADDLILELSGVCSRDKVSVGGVVDTRNPQKPINTNVQVTGITLDGQIGTHLFSLSDETTMSDNVNGTALGYMVSAYEFYKRNIFGFLTSADIGPRYPQTDPDKLKKLLENKDLIIA